MTRRAYERTASTDKQWDSPPRYLYRAPEEPRSLIPDEFRFVYLYGVPYYIVWEELHPGGSFFLKTTASAAEVRAAVREHAKHFNIVLKAHPRCEFGYYGVRVWRVA